MSDLTLTTQDGEVVLNNVPIKVEGDIGFELVNNYGRKIQQGDPGPDDHSVDSNIAQTEWVGGIGTQLYRGDESRSNSWFTTLWAQTRNVLALHPKTQTHVIAGEENNLAWVHSKLGGVLHASFGTKLKVWNESTDTFVDPGTGAATLSNIPTGRGITYGTAGLAKRIFFPMTSTFQTFTAAGVLAAAPGAETSIGFIPWDEKLIKLDANGAVKTTVDNVTWTSKGYIPEDYTPRSLFIFYDRSDNEVVHVGTSGAVYALDYVNSLLHPTDFEFPDHPYQALGVARWRADAYVSAGLGVHRNAGGLITAVGLDGREGVPEEYRTGYITSMIGGYNELYALVRGGTIGTAAVETDDAEVALPDPMYGQNFDSFSMLIGFNGLGWHPKWIGTKEPTNVVVSSQDSIYRAFWGERGAIHSQILPLGYYNPLYTQQEVPLERYGEHITPYYNWGFLDTPKILKTIELKTLGCDANNYVKIWIRYDDIEEWGNGTDVGTPLAILTTNGQHNLHVGYETIAGAILHTGLEHERFQLRIEMFGYAGNEYQTPVIEWINAIGRKWLRALKVFTFMADCSLPYKDLSARKMSDALYAAARKKGGVPLVIGKEIFVVDVTTDAGNIEAGMTYKSYHNITCVEMTEPDDDE